MRCAGQQFAVADAAVPTLLSLHAAAIVQVKPPAFDQHRYLQLLNERCELMSLLTHLYVGADALTHHTPAHEQLSQMTLSPDIYAAQTLLAQISARLDHDESDQAEADALTNPLKELAAMRWPSCSEQQFLQLLELLGSAVYAASAGAAAATVPSGQLLLSYLGAAGRAATEAAGSGGRGDGSRSHAVELQQLSEALVSDGRDLSSYETCLQQPHLSMAIHRITSDISFQHGSYSWCIP